MATFKQIPEEGRPPDSPGGKHLNRKLCSHTSISPWHNNPSKHPYHSNASTPNGITNRNHSECNNNNVFEVKASIVQDLNKNVQESKKKSLAASSATNKPEKSSLKQSLPKLLCLKKSPSVSQDKADINALKTLNVNALRVDNVNFNRNYYTVDESASKTLDNSNLIKNDCDRSSASSSRDDNSLAERPKNRNSFHQNVEEALSSLLWQPYEYQNNGKSQSVTSSSCSSPSSSLGDLDEVTKNDGTSQHCSFTDLHLPTSTSEMVINLPAKNLVDQSGASPRSCDAHTIRPTSWLSEVFSLTEVSGERVVSGEVNAVSDVNKSGDMQVNVSSSAPSVPQSNVLNISTAENGLRGSVTIQNQQNVYQKQNNLNLSSANVVGLPNHTRYASVPVSTIQSRPTGNTIFPNHVRHISEPSNQFVKYQNNNSPSQQGNVVPNHQRHSSQVDQSNLHQISHFRSSSVPKSMPIVPRHESSTNTTTTTVPSAHVNNARLSHKLTPQIHNNVSNVNVNFYRAVPVNVVSSVPTIHCLNTLSNVQGNSVSNVQVLPLGTNFQSQNNNGNQSHFPVTTVNSSTAYSNLSTSCTSGTTQVILHNTQANTNSIHIPSTYQNVNRNTLLNPQVVPVQLNNRSTVSTSTNTIANFFPPPPVTSPNQEIIQNGRPISTSSVVPMVTVQQNNDARPRTYSNAGINTTPPNGNTQQVNPSNPINKPNNGTARTFTSTEAQTDEISVLPPVSNELSSGNREHRRRERRERRHQRRINTASHRHTADGSTQINNLQNDRLPDILNSHLPPPYSTLPNGMPPQSVMTSMPPMVPPPQMVPPQMLPPPHGAVLQTVVPNNVVPPSGFVFPGPPQVVQGQVPLVQGPTPVAVPVQPPSGFRFPFPANGFRRGRFAEEPPKGCCGLLSWKPGSLRWFIALIALVAVCCVLVGTALGAMRPAGRDHLTVSLLMIGVGIVLVTVSGVAWRLTSHDSSTCRSMLGLGSTESVDVCTRRFVPRLPPSYGRPHHPYAAMMYPEFQYRPPPPSYQASMQEYRLRLLLLDRGNTPQIQAGIQNAVSPPPTYRSHAGSLLRAPLSSRRDASQSEYSCPPSYRSQNSSNRPGTLQSNSVLHSREQSLSLSESNHGGSVVNVVSILGSTEEDIALDNITLDSLKMEPETEINPVKMLLKSGSGDFEGSKDGNLVTIVQTSDQSPVIVTVSGSSQIDNGSSVQITEIPSEMEILAHL